MAKRKAKPVSPTRTRTPKKKPLANKNSKSKSTTPENNNIPVDVSRNNKENARKQLLPDILQSDAENNNVENLKLIINSVQRIDGGNLDVPSTPQTSAQNVETVDNLVKIEITEHELDNVQALEGINREYNELVGNVTDLTQSDDDGDGVQSTETCRPILDAPLISVVGDLDDASEGGPDRDDDYSDEECFSETEEKIRSQQEKELVEQFSMTSNSLMRKQRTYRRKPFKKIEGLEKFEKLFVRLVPFDVRKKLINPPKTTNNSLPNEKRNGEIIDLFGSDKPKKTSLPAVLPISLQNIEKRAKKVSKTEVKEQNSNMVNKTESLKMEKLLVKQLKRVQAKKDAEGTSTNSDDDLMEIEPYEYEKTSKTLYETYDSVPDENGLMILRCLLCPFTGERYKQMSLHYKFKHRETPLEEMYFCDIKDCKFKTVHKGMLKWHMRRHNLLSDGKPISDLFPCGQCNKVFESRKAFLIHTKHMHKDPLKPPKKFEYPCATCKYTATTEQNLKAHIYRTHVPDDLKSALKCNICGFETHYKASLKNHLHRVHLNLP